MNRFLLIALSIAWMVASPMAAIPARADHLPNKTVVLVGGGGFNLGETPWLMLREQFAMRGFPDRDILEFQYTGGSFGPGGTWQANLGGACESYSKASFLAFRKMMGDMVVARPNSEVFLVGFGTGGFVATMGLWAAALGADDPAIWQNLSGIASISGPMSGLSEHRAGFLAFGAVREGCSDISMIDWMEEVGDPAERFAMSEERGALATSNGYKIGSFGNTIDCAYRYMPDICPNMRTVAGERAFLLPLLGDERQTMYIKTGTLWREYNVAHPVPGEVLDNHLALLLDPLVMAEVAEFVLSQTR